MGKVDPELKLLTFLLVFTVSAVFAAGMMFPKDGEIFSLLAGLVGGVSGSLFTFIKQKRDIGTDPNTTTTVSTPSTVVETKS